MDKIDSKSKQQMTAAQFAAKFSSKKEIYFFLTVECRAYLPPFENITIYYLKDLVDGRQKCKLQYFTC